MARAARSIDTMSRVHLRSVIVASLLALAVASTISPAASAAPADLWSVLPFQADGVDPNVAATFRSLLEQDLGARNHARFVPAPAPCQEPSCAHAASARLGVRVVVFGSLQPLGTRLLVSATAVDGATGAILASDRMGVDRVEDLEAVARRLAESLTSGRPAASNAEIGTVTHAETQPPARRALITATSLRVGGVLPLTRDGYAGLGTGMAFDLGLWLEARHFAFEPRIGVRFDVNEYERGSYVEVPFDFGAFAIFGQGDFAPLVGGGVGLHYLHEAQRQRITLGSTMSAEHVGTREQGAWGFAAFGRAGLLLMRTYRARVLLAGDYNATFVELNGGQVAQSFVFGLSAIL